ncbi:SRPBCC family protein [Glaciecola siphonariae]|uniref:SRPBCC family protein n=1 Tax=Glaciecola siphonariae TaxID=521012 RepID=A0ABV9LYF8_9ALTE
MFHIKVERMINKPIQEVFDALSDHENYSAFKGVDASRLLEQGSSEKNGLGALREIVAGKSVLHERIVAFEPPHTLAYLIEFSKPLPYQHEFGRITLSEVDGKTRAQWESRGHIGIPILGTYYFDKQIQKFGARAFGSILKTIDMR